MPDSGSGTITPVSPGVPPTPSILNPFPWTILSLDRYARIMGINPAHFWQATATAGLDPAVMPVSQCGDVYHHYAWQDADKVSRFDIASEIVVAEQSVAKALGTWPGLMWIDDDVLQYPRVYRREMEGAGGDWRRRMKTVNATWKKIDTPGRRLATLVGSPSTVAGSLVYSDQNGDGLFETASIAIATTHTDIRDLHVYHAGMEGWPEWEIRAPRKAYISGGVANFVFDSWLFIDPDLYERQTVDGENHTIDISDTTYFVPSVDVYVVAPDPTNGSCKFSWDNTFVLCGDSNIGETEQDGWAVIQNERLGIFTPFPGVYSAAANGWTSAAFSGQIQPDKVRLWYRCGLKSREYLAGRSVDSLSNELARIIAYLATARMERPLCGCSNVHSLSDFLHKDMTRNDGAGGMFFSTIDVVNNPFGTRLGEVMAWRELVKLMGRIG